MSAPAKKPKGKTPAKGKAAAKGKTPAKGKATARTPTSIADHPRAVVRLRQMKGWGALAGFCVGAYAGLRAGTPLFDTGVRALLLGVAGYLLAWAAAVAVWRQIVVAEIRAVELRLAERDARQREAREAALAQRQAEDAATAAAAASATASTSASG